MPEPITQPEQQTAIPSPMPVEVVQPAEQPPDLGTPRPMTEPQQLVVPPVASPQAEDEQSYSTLGRIAHSLMGKQIDYRPNPETGQVERVVTARKPGDFFKSILAGALLGGALGAREESFEGGVATGGAGVIEESKKEEEAKYQRARTGMADVYAARKEQREAAAEERQKKAFVTEEQLRKAQIAQANAATRRENVLTQGSSYDFHEKRAEAGRLKIAPYKIAGMKPIYNRIGETAMTDLMKKKPEVISLDWEPIDVRSVTMPDGEVIYEQVFTAYDPNKKVKMTPELIKLYKDAGMDKYYPDWDTVATPDKELTPEQFIGLKAQYQTLATEDFERQKRKLDLETASANIGRAKAETAKYWNDIATEKTAKNKIEQSDKAMDRWNTIISDAKKAGTPITSAEAFRQLSPGDQTIIGESMRGLLGQITAAITEVGKRVEQIQSIGGTIPSETQQELDALVRQRDAVMRLATLPAMGPEVEVKAGPPPVPGTLLTDKTIVQAYLDKYGTVQKAMEAAKKDGWKIEGEEEIPVKRPKLGDLPMSTLSPSPYGE